MLLRKYITMHDPYIVKLTINGAKVILAYVKVVSTERAWKIEERHKIYNQNKIILNF